ncbi:gliding motility-associated C-terminal domain-containing protein [Capnocytophaga leadbetteri]|uniref:T9SS type B sorting domain-containing protein n=1 Tax=Capnocytophaga leadbetteri TaxID=327575 RepID=UPI00288BFEB7|nr:gliding motility-associated C-terminal domain-containing protein [Capnocytophaga leadbetteri]
MIETRCWGNYKTPPFYSTAGVPMSAGQVPRDPSTPNGRYFMIDLDATGEVFRKKIKDIDGTKNVQIRVKFLNIAPKNTGAILPNLRIKLLNGGTEVYTTPQFVVPEGSTWDTYSFTVPANGHTNLDFVIYSYAPGGMGNDLAMDDLEVFQLPDNCGVEVSDTVTATTLQMPTISANLSNCSPSNNTLNLVVTPTSSLFTYQYQMDGGALQNSNVFTGLAMGSTHNFKVHYKPVASVVTIVHEDFGVGANPTANSYVNPEYYFESMNGANIIYNGNGVPKDNTAHIDRTVDGEYAISVNIPPSLAFLWHTPTDASGTTNGRKLIIDLSTPNPAFYMRPISVLPNKRVDFSAAIFNLLKTTAPAPCNGTGTQIRVRFYPNKAAFLANLAPIKSQTISLPLSATPNDWKYLTVSLSAAEVGANTSLYFVLDLSALGGCNDIAVDDIVVTQQLAECTKDFTTTINTSVTNAFAGVTKLIGCGTSANANKAEVTIANVEGGSGTYEYSFDGITWTASNTSWLPVGTHTVSVRDAVTHGCPFDMSVTVPAALAQPTIKTEVFYACDGKAILNVGVANPDPELTYMYSLDGAAFTTTYVYTNVASGTHSISVQYEHRSVPSPYILMKEDFGKGAPKALPGIVPSTWQHQPANTGVQANDCLQEGKYTVAPQSKVITCAGWCWTIPKDHTSNGTDATGRYYAMNVGGATPGQVFYYKDVDNIKPNRPVKYEMYLANLLNTSCLPHPTSIDANIQIKIIDKNTSTVLDTQSTGHLPRAANDFAWRKYEGTLNPGNATSIRIQFIDLEAGTSGNDFAIDDITVYQDPDACGQVVSATKVVTANNQDIPAFTVSKTYNCATGKGALTVTPTATTGFTYTYTLGSTTYNSTTATFTGLDLEQTYTVSINYQAVSNTVTLLNEDFGTGTVTTSPYVPSKYYFQKLDGNPTKNRDGQTRAGSTTTPIDQDYRVAKELGVTQPFWHTTVKDHTGNTDGRMLFIWPQDAVGEIVYQREISVLPNNDIDYSLWTKYYVVGAGPAGGNPTIQAALYKSLADVAANTNAIPVNGAAPVTHTIPGNNVWKQLSYKVKAADVGNVTKLYLVVRDNTVNPSGGNDLALDDIVVTQKLPACTTSVTATLTKGDVATPTLTLPANLSVICSAPTASATISSWIASATATSTCGTATVTHNYNYPSNLCNVTGGAVTVTFSTTDPFGNVVTATRVISFATMTLTVTPTTLSVPNGALGGTTSSVVPNITLGGVASPSTNSVTITFSGLPTGVTSTTGGRLIVAPNTPAGSHTITYTVCETAGHNNCKTVTTTLVIGTGSLTVTPVTPLTVPNGANGGTTSSVLTGVRLNGNVVTNTNSVTITFSGLPAGVTTDTQGRIVIPAGTPATSTLVTYKVCEKLNPTNNCHIVTSTLVIGTGSLTVTPVTPLTVPNGISGGTTSSVLTGITLNGTTVTNTNSVTISFSGLPAGVTTNTNGQLVIPAGTPAGTHTITYKVCEKLNPTNCHTVTSTLVIGTGSLTVTPVTPLTVPNGISGGTTSSVLTGITLNGATVTNTNSVTISFSGLPAGVTTNTNGQLVIPAGTPAGTHTITYKVCEKLNPTNCHTVTSTLVIGTGSLTVTPVTPLTVPNGISGGTTSSVLTGITLNGATVTNTNSVTISFSGLPAGVTTNTNGQLVIPAGTPAGTHTITYKVCEKLNPTNCHTVTSTLVIGTGSLTVTPVTPLTVPNGISGGTTSSVLTGITLNGATVTNTNSVTISFSGLPAGVTTNTNGQLVIPAGTPAGTHTITYRVCETAGNNNCKTVNTQLVIGAATPTVSTETFTASTTTATVVPGTIGNILTNASVGTRSATAGVGGNVTITLTHTPTIPNAPQINPSTGSVTVSSNTPPGVYTITYTLCSAVSTCVPGVATITVPQLKPYIPNTTITHSGTQTTTRNILDGGKVNGGTQSATVGIGGTVTITSVTNPTPRTPGAPVPTLNPATGIVTVPPTTPNGTYTISYTVCTTATPTNCTTGVTTVVVANVTPTVVPDAFTASTTTATVVPGVIGNVLTNDRVGTQSATTGVGGNVTINVTRTPTTPNAPVLDASTGSVTVSGNTPAGVYSISYEVCNGALCTAATLTVTVPQLKPYIPAANITHSGTTTTTYTVTTGGSVKGGTQSATTGTGGTVTITNVVNPTPHTPGAPVPSLNPNNGVITVPPTTPNGVYTITYDVCTTATPTACSSHVATITVGSVTPTEIPEANDITAYTRINTPVTVGVTSSTTVTVSIPSQPANGTAVSNGDGTITYTPNNGFKGTDSFEYSLCNAAGCRTATISVRVTSELIIYNGVSIGGSDKNNHFHIEGIENYPNNTVRIYNRWGVKVFEMSGYNNTTKAFKGVSDARATLEASDNLPQGTYYYIIEYVDEHNKTQTETGWLYLKKN